MIEYGYCYRYSEIEPLSISFNSNIMYACLHENGEFQFVCVCVCACYLQRVVWFYGFALPAANEACAAMRLPHINTKDYGKLSNNTRLALGGLVFFVCILIFVVVYFRVVPSELSVVSRSWNGKRFDDRTHVKVFDLARCARSKNKLDDATPRRRPTTRQVKYIHDAEERTQKSTAYGNQLCACHRISHIAHTHTHRYHLIVRAQVSGKCLPANDADDADDEQHIVRQASTNTHSHAHNFCHHVTGRKTHQSASLSHAHAGQHRHSIRSRYSAHSAAASELECLCMCEFRTKVTRALTPKGTCCSRHSCRHKLYYTTTTLLCQAHALRMVFHIQRVVRQPHLNRTTDHPHDPNDRLGRWKTNRRRTWFLENGDPGE